jgi:hypothetical protein
MAICAITAACFWYFWWTDGGAPSLVAAVVYTVFTFAYILLERLQVNLVKMLEALHDEIVKIRGQLRGKGRLTWATTRNSV